MIASTLATVKQLVEHRLLLNAFFPSGVFAGALALLVFANEGGLDHWIEVWESYSGTVQALIVVSAISGLFFLAAFLNNLLIPIVQIFEGYKLPKPLRQLLRPLQSYRKKRRRTDTALWFPKSLRSTALGNIIGAAEDYPEEAYGANSIVAWPRLFLLLPAEFVASTTAAFDRLQFLLNVSLLSALYAFFGGLYVAFNAMGGALFLLVTVGGIVVAIGAYCASLEAALEYGLHIRAAFDLHRNLLLEALRRPLPATDREEQRVWQDVTKRLRGDEQYPLRYASGPANE